MNTTYTFDQLKEDVRKEAEALRVLATAEEIEKLNFEELIPLSTSGCIYGQMTGCCYSSRAATLIHGCCARYFTSDMLPDDEDDIVDMDRIRKGVNGTKVYDFIKSRTFIGKVHYSAIEAYILLPEAKNANLIAFIKGESETLDL